MTSHSACSSLMAVSPALLVLLATQLLLSHVQPAFSLPLPLPIHLQRRQSFFRCTGWGAGCSDLDYVFRPVFSQRPEPTRSRPRATRPSRERATHQAPVYRPRGYGLHFLFTSGMSWGANGKRSSDIRPAHNDATAKPLRSIIKDLLKRETLLYDQ